MSAHTSANDLPKDGEKIDPKKIGALKLAFFAIGFICLVATWILMFQDNKLGDYTKYSYLFAIIYFTTLAIGGLFWTILHHSTNSGWGIVVRRQMENLGMLLPFVFLLMIPFFVPSVREKLWEWDRDLAQFEKNHGAHLAPKAAEIKKHWEDERAGTQQTIDGYTSQMAAMALPGDKAAFQIRLDEAKFQLAKLDKKIAATDFTKEARKELMQEQHQGLLYKKYGYFKWANIRLVLIALTLAGMAWAFWRWSIANDKTGDKRFFLRSRYWSCGFIMPFGTAFTFLVIDLLMSMDYQWFSTMWGVYLFAGSALASMSLLVLIVIWLQKMGYLKVVSAEHYHLMGKLMLAFCIFWAYISFSQYFLIWYANIAEETKWYHLRNVGGWNTLSIILVACHFFVPFVFLLFQPLKKAPLLIGGVAVWNLIMHLLDMYWIVIPERVPSLTAGANPQLWDNKMGLGILGLDLLALVGVGGTLAFIFLGFILKSASLYPCRDPRLEESVNVVN